MKALIQRVSRAEVRVEGVVRGRIGPGMVVLLGVGVADGEPEARWLAEKTAKLRIFDDGDGKMNLALDSVEGGAVLVVSQFTLYGNAQKGNRPSYMDAARPEQAEALYGVFVQSLRQCGCRVETGVFQTMMEVDLVNDGPVTLMLETPVGKCV